MSNSQPTCGYFINEYQPLAYGFETFNLLSSPTQTLTINWQSPQSGFIFSSSYQADLGYGGTWQYPYGSPYQLFNNQQTWTVNIDLSKCYAGIMVYNTYTPINFTIEVDGETLSVSQILQITETTQCCQQINGYVSEIQLNNGLQLYSFTCSTFGLVNTGATQIPLGGGCSCGGITNCYACPTSGGTTNLACSNVTSSAPCSLPKFLNLPILTAPSPKSIISSKLWNSIVDNVYSAYNSLLKIRSMLPTINYLNVIYNGLQLYDILYLPSPYAFTSLIKAQKGLPLTADDFNKLISALEQVYNQLNQPLPYPVSPEFPDSVVRSETFSKIVNDLNALRQTALRSVLLTSTFGEELSNLPQNFAGQNVFVCSVSSSTYLSGFITIENFIIGQIPTLLALNGNISVSKLIIQNLSGTLTLNDTANVNDISVGTISGSLNILDFASVQNLFVDNILSDGEIVLAGNAYVQNLIVNKCQPSTIYILDSAIVNNLQGQASQCLAST